MEIHSETLNRFCNQHKILSHYIEDIPSQAINTRFIEGKWSIQETISYISRYHFIFMERLKLMLNDVNPFFLAYNPENDPEYQFTKAKTTDALLREIDQLRTEMKNMLDKFSPAEYSRVGTHAVLGRMNISQWMEFFLLHESQQFYKIFKQAGQFWSNGSLHHGNVISMPLMGDNQGELTG